METLVIEVNCRPRGRDGPAQLGITVEDPLLRKDNSRSKKLQQEQTSPKTYINHDYQNLNNIDLNPENRGLQITQIQRGSVIDRNGQFQVGDIIIEANGVNLQRSFAEAQRTLKQFVNGHASYEPLVLKVLRKSNLSSTPSSQTTVIERETPQQPPKHQNQTPTLPKSTSRHLVGAFNTREIGVKHYIKLRKAANGFGIKIAERDNMHGTRHRPIFITAIITVGSAYQDGRLKEGDMLLEVNGIDLQGKCQSEVTKMLKSIKPNEEVEFVVSRQEAVPDPPAVDEAGIHTYDIPLNDTKSAGLGLYLKYPRRIEDHTDLGIWIEKVITGGASWKDGRLQPDDQILAINGIDLSNLSNAEASETLTAAVCRGVGPEATPNTIRLKIQRRSPLVVAEILQNTNNSLENFNVTDSTLQNRTTNSSNSSDQNSQGDSVMSPQTQASNSLGLTSSCNERSNQNSSEKTNETTSSAISQITDLTNNVPTKDLNSTQSWDDESNDATNNDVDPFQRDGFGRQSISEKRHAQLNAWNTDTFRRNKRLQEEQEQQKLLEEQMARQRLNDDERRRSYYVPVHNNRVPTSYTSHEFNSIHDLQMNPVNPGQNERLVDHYPIVRDRKMNESFRAAVDRSYEMNDSTHPRTSMFPEMTSSVANSTASTANEERYLISNRNGLAENHQLTHTHSKSNDSNTIYKKSSSLLTKFLKIGSIKRKKNKSNTQEEVPNTGRNQNSRLDHLPKHGTPENDRSHFLTEETNNHTQTMPSQAAMMATSRIQSQVPVDRTYVPTRYMQSYNDSHRPMTMLPAEQQQMQYSNTLDNRHVLDHVHQNANFYPPIAPQMQMNLRTPRLDGRVVQFDRVQQPQYWQQPPSQVQVPNGLWVINSALPTETHIPSNIYGTIPRQEYMNNHQHIQPQHYHLSHNNHATHSNPLAVHHIHQSSGLGHNLGPRQQQHIHYYDF